MPHILVTRPNADAEPLALRLRTMGYPVTVESMMEIRARDNVKQELLEVLKQPIQAVIVTSGNAIRALSRMTPRKDLRLITVGEATEMLARRYGYQEVECASSNNRVDAVQLVDYIARKCDPTAGELLHICGTVTRGRIEERLKRVGFFLRQVMLYEAQPIEGLSDGVMQQFENAELDIVLFYSPRTADVFLKKINHYGMLDITQHLIALCFSDAVAEAIHSFTWKGVYVSDIPNGDSMLKLLESVRAERFAPSS